MINKMKNAVIANAGLALTTGKETIKSASAVVYTIDGVIYTKAASDLAALTGINIAAGNARVVSYFVDKAGNLSVVASREVANDKANFSGLIEREDKEKALIGWVLIKNASSSEFVGGTTKLDASNITATIVERFGNESL